MTSKEVLAEAGSHGFRPGRRAHDAVKAARKYVQSGKCVVVDVDLAKFFDRVNHDILIDRLRRRIEDAGVIRLIRAYLNAGIMAAGVVSERHLGTPQGGPLSPLLANVLLDEVDKVLEARGYITVNDDALREIGATVGRKADLISTRAVTYWGYSNALKSGSNSWLKIGSYQPVDLSFLAFFD